MRSIIGLMAATQEGIIGNQGALPWHYPDELDHFKKTTLGQTLVMGKKTYQSMPKALFKHRQACVLSNSAA